MMSRSFKSCVIASLFLAGLLSASNAVAGTITYDNTTFTGTTTNLLGFNHVLPYTDANSRVITRASGTAPGIFSATGLVLFTTGINFSNFASNTTDFGFTANSIFPSGSHITSVTFDNGDSYTTSLTFTGSNLFYHFNDTASFTAATVTFTGGTSYLTDFTTAHTDPPSSVPEPSSLALLAAGAAFAGVSVWRRRKAS
jgi:hypothetical protein